MKRRAILRGLAALPAATVLGEGAAAVGDWSQAKRIAVLGDSISSRNNGAAMHAWPELLDSMIRSMGVFDIEVRNYSVPGLQWQSAHVPTVQRLIGGALTPLDAVKRDGCDLLIICLGVNDRNSPSALNDALAFQADLPPVNVIWMRQQMFDGNGVNDSIVAADEQQRMNDVYTALGGDGFGPHIGPLYDMGYSFDMLHPTNSGKQWIASATYMYLQQRMPLTPITRNISWLQAQDDRVRAIMAKANT